MSEDSWQVEVIHWHLYPSLMMSSMLGIADWGFCPVGPTAIKSQKNQTEVYINYKLIGLGAQPSY